MISHKYKTLFFHIPKTAGQSIESYFLQLHCLNWEERDALLLKPNSNKDAGPPRLAHLKPDEYLKYDYISAEKYDEYFKFAVVRNPWSRAVSFYKFSQYRHIVSFNYFVRNELPRLFREKSWFYGPQFNFISIDDKEQIDYLARFENLEQDFKEICSSIKIPYSTLPHKNKAKRLSLHLSLREAYYKLKERPDLLFHLSLNSSMKENYTEYYDSSLKKIVSQLYKKDIKKFNYSFAE